jgi:hypothetical protein
MYSHMTWLWSYGSWIYNYLCNQCLSSLKLWVKYVNIQVQFTIKWYKMLSRKKGWDSQVRFFMFVWIENLVGISSLVVLNLSMNELDDISYMPSMVSLKILNLNNNHVSINKLHVITFIRYVSRITFIRYVSRITFIRYVSVITFISSWSKDWKAK